MRVLISAFSCGPGRGSEPGVGWNIAIEVARLGHEVVVLTQPEFAADIERERIDGRLPEKLKFDVLMPDWLARIRDLGMSMGYRGLTWHVVNAMWQLCALAHVRRRYGREQFDLVHHVTFASIRYPTLLGRLNVPTVLGPLGGGDVIPFRLRWSLPVRQWLAELARDVHTWSLRADPITRTAFHRARLIFLRTEAATVAVPRRDRHKVCIHIGLGTADMPEAEPRPRSAGEPLRLLYVGGLLHLKGVHLALRALACAQQQRTDAMMTVIGDGPARQMLEDLTHRLGVGAHVVFHGAVPRHQLLAAYRAHDVFLFPSLRDAGGMVILEAWCQALPVICLALGGPGQLVDRTCGRVVAAQGGEAECVAALAAEISTLAADEDLRMSLARGAVVRSRSFAWPRIVADLYAEIGQRIGAGQGAASRLLRQSDKGQRSTRMPDVHGRLTS